MRPIAWIALVLTAAGCGESTGPLADLSELGTSVAVVNTVFASPLVLSLDVFRFGATLAAPAAGAPLIPDSLLGKTLAFTCASQRYAESGDSGAPATGVRVVLYRRAPDGSIACPATAIGQLDLFDAGAPGTAVVRGVVTGPGGSGPLVDYTISHNVADAQGVATATGFVTDGQQRLDFQVTGEPGSGLNNTIATVQLDDAAADVHAVLHRAAQMGVDTYSDDLDLSVQHAAGSAELKGSVGWANTLRSWDEIVSVNDAPFAKVGGSFVPENEGPSISPIGGRFFFTGEERRVLLDFVGAPDSIRAGLAGVLGAGAHLVRIAL